MTDITNNIMETWAPIVYSLNSSIQVDGAPSVSVMTFPNPVPFHIMRIGISVTWTCGADGAASIVLYGHRRQDHKRTVVHLPQLTEVPDWLESIVLRALPVGIEVSWK
jgi:hypothetical protein